MKIADAEVWEGLVGSIQQRQRYPKFWPKWDSDWQNSLTQFLLSAPCVFIQRGMARCVKTHPSQHGVGSSLSYFQYSELNFHFFFQQMSD